MIVTSNSFEHSLSISNLDIVVERSGKCLTLAFNDVEGEALQEITLTAEQALALRDHLNSTAVQSILN